MVEVDVRGFSCPVPVVRTKKAFDESPEETVVVLVESAVSEENVSRIARSRGYSVRMEEIAGEYRITLTPPKR